MPSLAQPCSSHSLVQMSGGGGGEGGGESGGGGGGGCDGGHGGSEGDIGDGGGARGEMTSSHSAVYASMPFCLRTVSIASDGAT